MCSRGGRTDPVTADGVECAADQLPPDQAMGFGSRGRPNRLVWQFISLLWLTVLIAPIVNVIDSSYSVPEKVLLVGAAAGFVVGYVLVLRSVRQPPTARTYAGVAAMAVLLVALAIFDHWAWLNAVAFVTVSLGMRLPTNKAMRAVIGLTVITVVLAAVLGADADAVYTIGLTCFAVGFVSVGIRRIIDVNTELLAAREDRARLAVAEERERFARDLHDLLGHSLSVIALKSEVGQRLAATDPARAADELREIEAVAREALREVREAVGGYRRPTLATEVAGAREALTDAGIDVDASIRADGLRPDVEAVLAWAVREGATNVLRHSGARHCTIEVGIDGHDGTAVVSVVDDGLGAGSAQQPGTGPGGAGLLGLAERATAVGGHLESGPRRDGGFALRLSVPAGAVA
jgi:two-component system, NarL family, sensor histidine kinase DesK